MKTLLLSLLSVLTVCAETIFWNRNPETNITYYEVLIASNATQVAKFTTTATNLVYNFPNGTWTVYLTAYDVFKTDSQPSSYIYTKNTTLPPIPVPPAIDMAEFRQADLESYDRATDTWRNMRVSWTAIDLPLYGATNYFLRFSSPSATNVIPAQSNWYTFGSLKRDSYVMSVYTIGIRGQSPEGKRLVITGIKPRPVQNVIVNP